MVFSAVKRHQRRARIRSLLRRFRATWNAALAHERRGEHDAAAAIWERHRTIWCELQELGIDPEDMREVA